MQRKNRSPLFLMALTILIDFTGFGLILPLLAFWAERLGANALEVGLILTAYALAQFIFTPVLGALSDRYGRKPIILASLLIEAASLALTAMSGSLAILLAARFIGGIGASNIGSAQAVVSDVTQPEERAKGMGLIGASIGLGFVIGPALGGALTPLGATVPFWIASAVALLNAMLVLIFLRETRALRSTSASVRHNNRGMLFAGWRHAFRHPAVRQLVLVNLTFTIAFTAMEAVFPLFTQHTFHWGAVENGYVFTYIGLIVVIMQGGLVGQLVKRWSAQTILIGGLILLAGGLILLGFSTQLAILLISLGILSVGEGAVTPTLSTLLSFASPGETQGEILGLAQGIAGLGRILGPLVAGWIFTLGTPGAPFIVGGILVVLSALLAITGVSSTRRSSELPRNDAASPVNELTTSEYEASPVPSRSTD